MFDESDVLTILKDIRNNKHINIVETNHFLLRTDRKYCSYKLIYRLLKTQFPLRIGFQEFNKFKLFYPHPENNKYYLILIIFIESRNEIQILTTFPEEI